MALRTVVGQVIAEFLVGEVLAAERALCGDDVDAATGLPALDHASTTSRSIGSSASRITM